MIEEIRNDYTDDQNYTHIDVYEAGKEEGKSVAIICLDTRKVYYIDNFFRSNKLVTEAIEEVLSSI